MKLGYGEVPYGKEQGVTSRAAFHMQFEHEPWFISLVMPAADEGRLHERVELFLRLANMAYSKDELYWAHRFAAWAIHYMQDISQPFHARLIPLAGGADYLEYAFTWDKSAYREQALQRLLNYHFAYEGFTTLMLTRSFTEPDRLSAELVHSLRFSRDLVMIENSADLIKDYLKWSADSAPLVAAHMKEAWGDILDRKDYDIITDRADEVKKQIPMMQQKGKKLLKFARLNFNRTGAAARNILRLMMLKTLKTAGK